jgi:hypothetical protein
VKPYRVLVTGSRDWPTPSTVWSALNDTRDEALLDGRPLVVVHGACPRGADQHAAHWCEIAGQFATNVTEEAHPANWDYCTPNCRKGSGHRRRKAPGDRLHPGVLETYCPTAGPRRNYHLVNLGADTCLAFIAGGSRGASHTARLAEEAGIPVRRWTA